MTDDENCLFANASVEKYLLINQLRKKVVTARNALKKPSKH